MDVALLRQQHDLIEGLSAELAAVVAAETVQPVGALRWRLAREVIGHLAIEDRWFYPHIIDRGTAETARLARAFQTEMGNLASDFTHYMAEWTDRRIVAEWPTFGNATATVLDRLRNRIGRENDQLYPICDFLPPRQLAERAA